MATFTIFDEAVNNIGKNLIDLDSHTFNAYLSNVAPDQAAHAVKADIAEIAAGNGYTAGGVALTTSWAETGAGLGVWRFDVTGTDPSWTASAGNIATHRYLIVYSNTATNDELVGYVDRGSTDVITAGNTRTWTVGANGLFETTTTP